MEGTVYWICGLLRFLCHPGLLAQGCPRLGPRTPIINQENAPYICPQHSPMEVFSADDRGLCRADQN